MGRTLAVSMLLVILVLSCLPYVRADTGPGGAVIYTGSGPITVAATWSIGLTQAPSVPITATGILALDGRYGAGVTVPLSYPVGWLADRAGIRLSDGFQTVLANTDAGPAALTDKFEWQSVEWGALIKWTAYRF